jgi:hypothetical protein
VFFTWGENCAEKKKEGDEVSVGEALSEGNMEKSAAILKT